MTVVSVFLFIMILAFLIFGSYLAICVWIDMVNKVTKALCTPLRCTETCNYAVLELVLPGDLCQLKSLLALLFVLCNFVIAPDVVTQMSNLGLRCISPSVLLDSCQFSLDVKELSIWLWLKGCFYFNEHKGVWYVLFLCAFVSVWMFFVILALQKSFCFVFVFFTFYEGFRSEPCDLSHLLNIVNLRLLCFKLLNSQKM